MYTTPGVYFEQLDRGQPAIGPLRTDIAGFVGYAQRGPLFAPLKLTTYRQFRDAFGDPLAYAYLPYAVRGFFENGGAACYAVRIADRDRARAASVDLLDGKGRVALRVYASYGELHDPTIGEALIVDGQPVRLDSPGVWGNRLAVSVRSAGLAITQTAEGDQPSDGQTSYVESLSGLQVGTVVRCSQDGREVGPWLRIVEIDRQTRQVWWNAPLTGLRTLDDDSPLDLSRPLRLTSVELSLLVLLDGQVVERHMNLSLSEEHDRYLLRVLRDDSALIDADIWPDLDLSSAAGQDESQARALDPLRYPLTVEGQPLTRGHDGLATIELDDWTEGIDALAQVDEVSLVAAPDVVLRAEEERAASPRITPRRCDRLDLPSGELRGRVVEEREADDGGTEEVPLRGVIIQPLDGSTAAVTTGANGAFVIPNVDVGLLPLRLSKEGYYTLETTAQAHPAGSTRQARFALSPITLPPALSLDEVHEVQSAMIRQGAGGLYRVAVLDPPADALGIDAIQTWRARFDSAFGALYYPWLQVSRHEGGVISVPPSGHVVGLIAHTDLAQGVHRAPANAALEGVKAVTDAVNDAQQGLLNPLGINCLRVLPGRGIRVYGARTLSSDPEWRYLNVRRLLLMIEEAIEESNQWAVFEPNDQVLRQALTFSLNTFLHVLWQAGALAGDSPAAAFQVVCNESNNPSASVDAGELIADIAVAPTVPFEFIRFRLGRTVEAIQVRE